MSLIFFHKSRRKIHAFRSHDPTIQGQIIHFQTACLFRFRYSPDKITIAVPGIHKQRLLELFRASSGIGAGIGRVGRILPVFGSDGQVYKPFTRAHLDLKPAGMAINNISLPEYGGIACARLIREASHRGLTRRRRLSPFNGIGRRNLCPAHRLRHGRDRRNNRRNERRGRGRGDATRRRQRIRGGHSQGFGLRRGVGTRRGLRVGDLARRGHGPGRSGLSSILSAHKTQALYHAPDVGELRAPPAQRP